MLPHLPAGLNQRGCPCLPCQAQESPGIVLAPMKPMMSWGLMSLEDLLCAVPEPGTFQGTPGHLTTALGGRDYWGHFSEGETEARKSEVTCPRPLS